MSLQRVSTLTMAALNCNSLLHTLPHKVFDTLHSFHDLRKVHWERSGSVVECLTQDQEATGSSLTGVTALWSLSKTHLSVLA